MGMDARISFRHFLCHAVVCMSGILMTTTATAQDFRIESEITLDDEKQPVSENLTLFAAGIVYDFSLVGPKEITIFDPRREQFVLLDVERKMRLTLSNDQILQMNAAIRTASNDRDPFFFDPKFEESFDEDDRSLTLSNERIQYAAQGSVPDEEATILQYRQFADWYARLNATRPGTMPPFARLELNRAMAARGIVPEQVRLTIYPKHRFLSRKTEAKSKHLFVWQLSNTDRTRIEKANHYRATFDEVSFRTYRRIDNAQ